MSGRVFLFDVDATLIKTGRAGSRAFAEAFESYFGTANATEGVRFHGRTDLSITREMLRKTGHSPADESAAIDGFFTAYLPILERLVAESKEYVVLPGVVPLLEALTARGDHLGLATGNISRGAHVKVGRGDLSKFFHFGGFGDDAEDRGLMVKAARLRAEEKVGRKLEDEEIFVIGDSELDVAAAHAARCRSIAVGTGMTPEHELRAAGAEFYFEDLGGAEQLVPFAAPTA